MSSSQDKPSKPISTPSTSVSALFPPIIGSSSSIATSSLPTSADAAPSQPPPEGQVYVYPTNPASPEKCFSFCTQSHNAAPFCRMLCFRKRLPIPDRASQLARLRPPSKKSSISELAEGNSEKSGSTSGSSWSWSPIEALRKKVELYSILYIKGNPDGVVGRYMEEMEYDDGEHDFKELSRGGKRKADPGMEYMEWDEHGSLFHLPLTSLFYPILSLPASISRLATPPMNLLNTYYTTFTDGTQSRALERFTTEVRRGGALDMLGKVRGHWAKKVKEREEILRQASESAKEKDEREESG